MVDKKKVFDLLVVVKRSGQRTEFNGEKIALAIKKAFDSVDASYRQEDVNRVYQRVLEKIEEDYQERKTIKIEDVQDIIEEQLKKLKFFEVYDSFSSYREQRAASREIFVIKQQHKFLKAIENLGFNNLYEKESGKMNHLEEKSSSEILNNFGGTIAREFAKAYLLDNKYVRAHDDGIIHIHHLETLAMGTTQSIGLDLDRLYKNGFSFHVQDFSLPSTIGEAIDQIIYLLQGTKSDQCGNQGIGSLDFYLAPYVLKSFQKSYQQILFQFLEKDGFLDFVSEEKILREIEKMTSLKSPEMMLYLENQAIQKLFDQTYSFALREVEKEVISAVKKLIENINILSTRDHLKLSTVAVSFGTDCSDVGRLVTRSFLSAYESFDVFTYPIVYFKLKKGINLEERDLNHDLFVMAQQCVTKKNFAFSFLDSSYNRMGSSLDEVSYLPFGERIVEDITSSDEMRSSGKGTVSTTSLNLARIAIRQIDGTKEEETPDMKKFYDDLEETLDLIKDQMLERFEVQCSKHSYNFPFLIEESIWLDGDKVKPNDRLRKILKHGVLAIHFTGLAETLKALFGKNHGEDAMVLEQGVEIVRFMKKKVEEYAQAYNLNFVLSGVSYTDVSERFLNIDKAIYGKMKGITDQTRYTTSFQIPSSIRIKVEERINIEGKFHPYVLGGHFLSLELEKNKIDQASYLEKLLFACVDSGIGCVGFTEK